MRKRIVPIILIVVVAIAAYFGWRSYQAATGGNVRGLGGSGTIETQQLALTPQTSGRIIAGPAEEGVPVHKGQVLYRLDPTMSRLNIQSATAGLRAAQANLKHVNGDSASNSADKAAARAQVQQAKIARQMAIVSATYTVVTSPIEGSIANIAANPGENAVPGSTLAILSNPASLTVTIYVPENEIGQVKIGQAGTLTTDSTTKKYNAVVVFVSSQAEFTPASIETKDQRVKLVYQVKLNITDPDGALKAGMPADVTLAQ